MEFQATVQMLGSVGEFLGSIAVLATLVYLAVQTRMTRRSLDAQAVYLSAGATAQGAYTIASSPETAEAWTKAMAGEELEGRELAVYQMSLQAALVSLDGALSARKVSGSNAGGPIDDVWDKAVRAYVSTPSFKRVWATGYLQDSLTDLTTEFVQTRVN